MLMWKELGVANLTAPLELNRHELLDLNGIYENIIVYARIPLIVTAQCLEKTASNIQLVDRQNVKFPVKRNCRHCYNTIYNSLPLSLQKTLQRY